ncbi:preprotein translocase subunit SecD [Amycolatopsis arida]|uniref:Protein translocase subunit SecD n=1 Tax=Amycolatopsis arida TaxID=587909 RepID=A0A1I5Z5E4_9PSEU|nr:protein translocase subunit SecD [Amycolatopsis arida]TDX90156.1 preprotein translocase subunit SecD [Amycolatopsis arida]SFQ51681.1 preprotein translocase subunit SecD [Amycolatopsis arida]
MAPPAGQIRPGRYLAFFALIVAVLYSLVFLTGDGKPTPKLGIDLQGGTRVILTARTPDGGEPSREALERARQIIDTRVNGIGVSGAEVVLDGNNVVITVPGEEGEQAKNLGRTAKLYFRKVINAVPAGPATAPGQQPPAEGQQPPEGQPGAEQQPDAGQQQGDQQQQGADQRSEQPAGGGGAPAAAPAQNPPDGGDGDGVVDDQTAQEIQQAKELRQNPALVPENPGDPAQAAAAQQAQQQALVALDCGQEDPLRGNDDPNLPLVTCAEDGTEKFVLGPSFLPGEQISDATATPATDQPGWSVNLEFKSEGTQKWAEFTSANVGQRAAFVLDTQVVSAPTIQVAILDGKTRITGNFSQTEAKQLADVLKYGSLPLSFVSSDAKTVSATLGLSSLQAGLIAGGIGIALVFVYCLFYYRILGVLTVLSLFLSATVVYAVLVLLGRWIGFTLDLAGVAGFIIAIGVTADSFVVYFERLKDEMREGRTFRSAVSRGWIRARRTILASDAVLFLASAVLYTLAVGEVKGFAFTLGMSTVLDLSVVFLVTHPLVALIARSKRLSSPKLSGLGAVQRLGASRRAAGRVPGAVAKEA